MLRIYKAGSMTVEMMKDSGFVQNNAMENVVENSYQQQALKVYDANVMFQSPSMVFGQNMSSSSILHTVYNGDSTWACCSCPWAELGNICKHQIKVLLMKGISNKHLLRHCVDLFAERVGHTHAHAPHFIKKQKVKEMKSSLQDDVIGEPSTCKGIASPNTHMVSSSPPRPPKGRITHLESLCANLLGLVGEDCTLIIEATSQQKRLQNWYLL